MPWWVESGAKGEIMIKRKIDETRLPDDLLDCIMFHGHLCPGLVYGYLAAKKAMDLLYTRRSRDEEVVTVCENDSCAVDAFQILLGTTAGKGNLILKNYGKSVYSVYHRASKKAFRFSRRKRYRYNGEATEEFRKLDTAVGSGTATEADKLRLKMLKAKDLLTKPFEAVFTTSEITDDFAPPFARLDRSEACASCGEMTMSTRLVERDGGDRWCIPCSESDPD